MKDLEKNAQEKEQAITDIALEGGSEDLAASMQMSDTSRRWGAFNQAMNNLAYATAGSAMLGSQWKQLMFIAQLDVRVLVFASGAISLNAFGFLVFFTIFACKTVWMDATLNPFFCAANTYFGIYGAVVLWTNPLFQVYLGNSKFNELENFTETPIQARIRMNMTMEAVKYFEVNEPLKVDYGNDSWNPGNLLEKVWGPLTMLVVWALISAGCCIFIVCGFGAYFICCRKKDDMN